MRFNPELEAHLQTGATTTCRAWRVTRTDGTTYGFTDHDLDLEFEGTLFRADSGLTAGALQKSTGLAVDNTEVANAVEADADAAANSVDNALDDAGAAVENTGDAIENTAEATDAAAANEVNAAN